MPSIDAEIKFIIPVIQSLFIPEDFTDSDDDDKKEIRYYYLDHENEPDDIDTFPEKLVTNLENLKIINRDTYKITFEYINYQFTAELISSSFDNSLFIRFMSVS
jgi:hypothetical protein